MPVDFTLAPLMSGVLNDDGQHTRKTAPLALALPFISDTGRSLPWRWTKRGRMPTERRVNFRKRHRYD
jgi:hypothetical protein